MTEIPYRVKEVILKELDIDEFIEDYKAKLWTMFILGKNDSREIDIRLQIDELGTKLKEQLK